MCSVWYGRRVKRQRLRRDTPRRRQRVIENSLSRSHARCYGPPTGRASATTRCLMPATVSGCHTALYSADSWREEERLRLRGTERNIGARRLMPEAVATRGYDRQAGEVEKATTAWRRKRAR